MGVCENFFMCNFNIFAILTKLEKKYFSYSKKYL